MIIRKYEEKDIEQIHDIVDKTFEIKTNIENIKRNIKKDNIECNVLEINNKIVGSIFLTYEEDIMKGNKLCRIDYFTIDSEYRNKGYGNILLEYALKNMRKVDIIYLTSSEKRKSARHLYKKYGFEIKDTDLFIKII